ncbi:S8 family serine peptidase [Sphingobium baderi]|uniref:S8 family serine peptidase n=1 Tax=Sphingobium baderi TaxID=1332080 RepID=UPI0009EAEBF0|nr:S8 family serine peptidase [Sphingobium baderi]
MRTGSAPLLAPLLALAILVSAPAAAQLGLPPVGPVIGDVLDTTERALDPLRDTVGDVTRGAARLADARASRLSNLVRRNRESMELDADGAPARRGELLLIGANDTDIAKARDAGFAPLSHERLDALEIDVVRLAVPSAMPLAKAQAALRKLRPDATISADTLYFQAGAVVARGTAARAPTAASIDQTVGVIDGAPGATIAVTATRRFAEGASASSDHGSAVASILGWAGVRRIVVADVYGADPAGGNALAIARGLDWLIGRNIRVVSISLVGPSNPVVARAVSAAQRRGVYIIAAVGNDGPAAPPAYPASYPHVIAVTAVDGRNRALIEAGRAAHLDYAAPGADLLARNAAGRWVRVRGTSYAVPFVAARVAAALGSGNIIPTLDREAVDLGRRGVDSVFGRGLLCQSCARRK